MAFELKNHFQNEKINFLKMQDELVWILCVHNVDCNVLIIETDPEHHDSSCSNKLHIWLDPDHATTKLSRKWLILVRRRNIEVFFWKTIFIRSISNSLDMWYRIFKIWKNVSQIVCSQLLSVTRIIKS